MSENRMARIFGTTLLSLLCWYGLTVAQPGTVFLEPDSAMISTLDTVSIELRVDQGVAGIHCFMVSVDCDTTLLEIVSVTEGPLLKTGGSTFFFWDDLRHPTDVGNCILGYGLHVDGPGVLAVVRFRAFQKGGTSPLSFSYVNFSDVNLDSMAVGHSDGKVVVRANPAPTIISAPVTNGRIGELYVYDVDATGLPIPTYALQSTPTPPAGMTIDAVTGMIQWTPSTAGDFDVAVSATNTVGESIQAFTIRVACCSGRVGDANGQGEYPDEITLGDIMLLVDVKFISSDCSKLTCLTEADVNQDGGTNPNCEDHVTLGDIMTLVDFLFITGPENATLPECL
jgi:hypothetical protein